MYCDMKITKYCRLYLKGSALSEIVGTLTTHDHISATVLYFYFVILSKKSQRFIIRRSWNWISTNFAVLPIFSRHPLV